MAVRGKAELAEELMREIMKRYLSYLFASFCFVFCGFGNGSRVIFCFFRYLSWKTTRCLLSFWNGIIVFVVCFRNFGCFKCFFWRGEVVVIFLKDDSLMIGSFPLLKQFSPPTSKA